jgi:hypothetical protein
MRRGDLIKLDLRDDYVSPRTGSWEDQAKLLIMNASLNKQIVILLQWRAKTMLVLHDFKAFEINLAHFTVTDLLTERDDETA